jgi:hypothetical protein
MRAAEAYSLPLFYGTISPKRMSQDVFQKELLVDLKDYRCPECAGFDFEASKFIPIQTEEKLHGTRHHRMSGLRLELEYGLFFHRAAVWRAG